LVQEAQEAQVELLVYVVLVVTLALLAEPQHLVVICLVLAVVEVLAALVLVQFLLLQAEVVAVLLVLEPRLGHKLLPLVVFHLIHILVVVLMLTT
jgi:hypothetical protein